MPDGQTKLGTRVANIQPAAWKEQERYKHTLAQSLERTKLGTAAQLELIKLEAAKALEDYRSGQLQQLELAKSYQARIVTLWRGLFDFALLAIRTVVAVNGAGVMAIIALLQVQRGTSAQVLLPPAPFSLLASAAAFFAAGIAAGLGAAMLAYLSQHALTLVLEKTPVPTEVVKSRWQRHAGVACIHFGLGFFLAGVTTILIAFH
jgi:hypothetical protein